MPAQGQHFRVTLPVRVPGPGAGTAAASGRSVARAALFRIVLVAQIACACRYEPAAVPGDVLRVAVRADVTGFFPSGTRASEAYTHQISAQIVEGLVRLDRSLVVQPALAERWETPYEHTYLFHLRPGLRFSDGRPLTAEDVAASIEAARTSPWGTQDSVHAIASIRALDQLRVEIRTRGSHRLLLQTLHWGFVLPKAELGRTPIRTIGSGPFQLQEWRPGAGFTLERNPHYRGPAPDFERVVFSVVPEAAERVERLLRGQADVIDHVPLDRLAELRGSADVQVFAGSGLRVLYLGLRVDRPPFADPRLREAVARALDRERLVSGALHGLGLPAHQLVPPTVAGYDPTQPPEPLDRARARSLLAAAGRAGPMRVRLDGPRNRYTNDTQILAELAHQLAEVGFEVEVNALDKRDFFPLIDAGGSDLHLFGWACQSGQASELLDAVLHSPAGPTGAWNTLGLADPVLDRLIESANASRTQREWSEALKAALRHALAWRAAIPLVVEPETLAFGPHVRWSPAVDYLLRLEDMHTARGPR